MKNIKFYFIFISCLLILIVLLKFFILKDINNINLENLSVNILENKNLLDAKDSIKNEKYNYEISSEYSFEFKNDNKFLSLKDVDCVLNLVSFENKENISICDWVKKECSDLDCDNYFCEYYRNDWYKVRYFGSFMGSSDYELVFKNDDYIYSANLECFSHDLDNYNNPLFSDLILNFKVKQND